MAGTRYRGAPPPPVPRGCGLPPKNGLRGGLGVVCHCLFVHRNVICMKRKLSPPASPAPPKLPQRPPQTSPFEGQSALDASSASESSSVYSSPGQLRGQDALPREEWFEGVSMSSGPPQVDPCVWGESEKGFDVPTVDVLKASTAEDVAGLHEPEHLPQQMSDVSNVPMCPPCPRGTRTKWRRTPPKRKGLVGRIRPKATRIR